MIRNHLVLQGALRRGLASAVCAALAPLATAAPFAAAAQGGVEAAAQAATESAAQAGSRAQSKRGQAAAGAPASATPVAAPAGRDERGQRPAAPRPDSSSLSIDAQGMRVGAPSTRIYRSVSSDGRVVFGDHPETGAREIQVRSFVSSSDSQAVATARQQQEYWRTRAEGFERRQRERDAAEAQARRDAAERELEALMLQNAAGPVEPYHVYSPALAYGTSGHPAYAPDARHFGPGARHHEGRYYGTGGGRPGFGHDGRFQGSSGRFGPGTENFGLSIRFGFGDRHPDGGGRFGKGGQHFGRGDGHPGPGGKHPPGKGGHGSKLVSVPASPVAAVSPVGRGGFPGQRSR